jgi:hemin uptake protein HemP
MSDNDPLDASGGIGKPDVTRSISSDELLAGQRMIIIRHRKEEYRLQVTGTGKLILTK